ncbi:ferrous iron binding protein [Aureococcus anophagefferens]|nr:ferrous iron binding protein [Aureococcus anophagefferens]
MSALDFQALYAAERRRLKALKQKKGPEKTQQAPEPAQKPAQPDAHVSCLDAGRPRPTPIALDALPTIAYAADFVTEAEERALVAAAEAGADWVSVRGRRLRRLGQGGTRVIQRRFNVSLGGPAGEPGFAPEPLPAWAAELCAAAATDDARGAPNHARQRHDFDAEPLPFVFPHTDGPAYDDRTATLSCGADCVMTFSRRLAPEEVGVVAPSVACTVALRRRSLLVFSGAAYAAHTHAIDAAESDVVAGDCANADLAGVAVGDVLPRRGLRHSFTLRRAKPIPSK